MADEASEDSVRRSAEAAVRARIVADYEQVQPPKLNDPVMKKLVDMGYIAPGEQSADIRELVGLPPLRDGFDGGPVQGARPGRKASDIMREMATTMDARNDVYKDNWRMIGPMVKILFPNGVPPELVTQDFWHLFELMLVKVARFASTNCTHVDSIHDAGAYCGFVQLAIEESLKEKE